MSTTTAEEFYTERELEMLFQECITHAVFSWVGEFGKEEYDFLNWLATDKVSFKNAMTFMSSYLETYTESLEKSGIERVEI